MTVEVYGECRFDGAFYRMNHDREPGIGRVYASVLRDGTIAPGDAVIVEPG